MTIGLLGEKFGLSRSTLLYYDKIGLLSPKGRSPSNYRIYTKEDVQKLEKICMYRKTGVKLEQIGHLLSSSDSSVWEERLGQLNNEIKALRVQQKMILEIIKNPDEGEVATLFRSDRFSTILRSLGMSDNELEQFHIKLEQTSSVEHRSFLFYLGLNEEEADKIIEKTKKTIKDNIKSRPV